MNAATKRNKIGVITVEMLSELFTNYWLHIVIAVFAAYLISSVNTSIIVTRIVKHEDIRKLGSGNAGFTNVLRCVGKGPAIITFVGDFLKGVISIMIPYIMTLNMGSDPHDQQMRTIILYLGGIFAVLGHMFPIYYKFKGGKGVVTTAAVMLMTDWRVLIIELLIFAVFFMITKIVSKGSLMCAAAYPFVAAALRLLDSMGVLPALIPINDPTPMFIACVFVLTFINGAAVIIKHKDNIKRILDGSEKKITKK